MDDQCDERWRLDLWSSPNSISGRQAGRQELEKGDVVYIIDAYADFYVSPPRSLMRASEPSRGLE